eukprot:4569940-Amphidinium_carterae.1
MPPHRSCLLTLLWLLLSAGVHSVRHGEALGSLSAEAGDNNVHATPAKAGSACKVLCRRPEGAVSNALAVRSVPASLPRFNQGRYEVSGEDVEKVSWRLKSGATYTVKASAAACSDDSSDVLSEADVVPWIPTHGDPLRNSTIDVYIDPEVAAGWLVERRQQKVFVCASDIHGLDSVDRCICELEMQSSDAVQRGVLLAVAAHLPSVLSRSLLRAQLSWERQCPNPAYIDYL